MLIFLLTAMLFSLCLIFIHASRRSWSLDKWILQTKTVTLLWYTQVLYEKVCNFGILVISIVNFLQEAVHTTANKVRIINTTSTAHSKFPIFTIIKPKLCGFQPAVRNLFQRQTYCKVLNFMFIILHRAVVKSVSWSCQIWSHINEQYDNEV